MIELINNTPLEVLLITGFLFGGLIGVIDANITYKKIMKRG